MYKASMLMSGDGADDGGDDVNDEDGGVEEDEEVPPLNLAFKRRSPESETRDLISCWCR